MGEHVSPCVCAVATLQTPRLHRGCTEQRDVRGRGSRGSPGAVDDPHEAGSRPKARAGGRKGPAKHSRNTRAMHIECSGSIEPTLPNPWT